MSKGYLHGTKEQFACLNIYAPQKPSLKRQLWEALSILLINLQAATIILVGDFNTVLSPAEREGCEYRIADSTLLSAFLTNNNLLDVNLMNSSFTWFGPSNRKSRIDRALVNTLGFVTGDRKLLALNRKNSDHRPIVLSSKVTG